MQEYKSAQTSLNQVPALFKTGVLKPGTRNLDLGGGKYDLGTEYLKRQGVESLVYDPYNRDKDHNDRVWISAMQHGVDSVTCCNVLNVIKGYHERASVIGMARDIVKGNGVAYFQIYEGDKSGIGRETKAECWQNNMLTKSYVREVNLWFPHVWRKGNVIEAWVNKAA